jgi:hypothetical protein
MRAPRAAGSKWLAAMAMALAAASRSGGAEPGASPNAALSPTETQTPAPFLPIRYEDGAVTENDRCAVSRKHLNPKVAPVYVNGRVIGFC